MEIRYYASATGPVMYEDGTVGRRPELMSDFSSYGAPVGSGAQTYVEEVPGVSRALIGVMAPVEIHMLLALDFAEVPL